MGFVTGPRRSRCRPGCSGWPHFVHAVEAILYHELALIASGVAVVALTWNGANQVGAWTFLILWAMRESAKLNLFLGVRNLNEEFLPPHMQFLRGFLTKRPMNLLFPVSITASTAVAVLMITEAAAPWASSFDAVGLTLAATMLVLAIVEHWLLVLPLPTDMLWSWGMRSREGEHHHSRRDRGSDPPLATDLVEPIRVKRA
jgi:putative photosynthetic complex assembly protein 2